MMPETRRIDHEMDEQEMELVLAIMLLDSRIAILNLDRKSPDSLQGFVVPNLITKASGTSQ